MGRIEGVMLAVIVVLLGIVFLTQLLFPESCREFMEGRYDPVPGNDTCWLSLCVKEGVNADCIRFPLGYSDCAELRYACRLDIIRDREYPNSSVWFEEMGFSSCIWDANASTCYCIREDMTLEACIRSGGDSCIKQ